MGEVFFGTSGYDYPAWKGAFYPANLQREGFLPFYSSRFSALEITNTFLRIPEARQLVSFAERGAKNLACSFKVHESFTHKIDPSLWSTSVRAFRNAFDVLFSLRRRDTLLFQFPSNFHYTPDNRRYLDKVLREFATYPLVVEFGNAEWINNRVIEAFRERGTTLAALDGPAIKGLPPSVDTVSGTFAYIRFHGRNSEAWTAQTEEERHRYHYTEKELQPWVHRIKNMLACVDKVFVFFNNCPQAAAPLNAEMLRDLYRKARSL